MLDEGRCGEWEDKYRAIQLPLFPEPGKRGGVINPNPGPSEGDTIEAVAVAFRPAGFSTGSLVTFLAGDGFEATIPLRPEDAPLGLAQGDLCTLAWRGGGWRLASVDSGREAGG